MKINKKRKNEEKQEENFKLWVMIITLIFVFYINIECHIASKLYIEIH
jgi:hypothetical protein